MNNNNVKFIGYVATEPEFVETPGKTPYAKYALSVQTRRKGADGKYETKLVDVTAFGTEAYFAQEHITKNSRVVIEGTIDFSTKSDGTPRKNIQVIVDPEGQSIRPKTSRFFSKNTNTSLAGDAPVTSQFEGGHFEEDITPVDDGDMPF